VTANEYAEGLRLYADWLDRNAALVEGGEVETDLFFGTELKLWGRDKATLSALARAFGKCDKVYRDDLFELHKQFGAITVKVVAARSAVCRQVVTEEKVTEMVPDPAVVENAPLVEVERVVQTVEWVCYDPILAETAA